MEGENEHAHIRGVIFVLDGTLIKTTIDFQQMRTGIVMALNEFNVPPDVWGPNDTTASMSKVIKYMASQRTSDEMVRFEKRISGIWNDVELLNVAYSREIPGAEKTLSLLRGCGYRLGVLTRSSREYALKALDVAGIDFEFDAMVCRDDHPLAEAKPNPLSLRRAVALLNLESIECIYVGDHAIDEQCAKAAGLRFVGVLSGSFDLERWKGTTDNPIIGNISDIPAFLGVE